MNIIDILRTEYTGSSSVQILCISDMIHGCPSISTSVTIRGPFAIQNTEHLSSTGSTENDNRIPRYSYPWILQGKNSKQNAKIDEPLKPLRSTENSYRKHYP